MCLSHSRAFSFRSVGRSQPRPVLFFFLSPSLRTTTNVSSRLHFTLTSLGLLRRSIDLSLTPTEKMYKKKKKERARVPTPTNSVYQKNKKTKKKHCAGARAERHSSPAQHFRRCLVRGEAGRVGGERPGQGRPKAAPQRADAALAQQLGRAVRERPVRPGRRHLPP